MRKKKVYIPNANRAHIYTGAKRFGDIVKLTSGNLDKQNVSFLYRTMEETFAESSKFDYILISGAIIANIIAAGFFAAKHGRLNLLLYRHSGKYVKREIDFSNIRRN